MELRQRDAAQGLVGRISIEPPEDRSANEFISADSGTINANETSGLEPVGDSIS